MQTLPLSDPDQRPGRAVVIYDGHCIFCTKQVQRIARFDFGQLFTYLSLHDGRVSQRYPNLTFQQLMDQMWLVLPDGRQFGGIDAVRVISRKLWILWPLAVILHIPFTGWLWRSLYRTVARFRYYLGGKKSCDNGQCSIR
jgi:predicted DCC family thiol-disulfide oxidoreductase YuxK